jgi:hypothetical protein
VNDVLKKIYIYLKLSVQDDMRHSDVERNLNKSEDDVPTETETDSEEVRILYPYSLVECLCDTLCPTKCLSPKSSYVLVNLEL